MEASESVLQDQLVKLRSQDNTGNYIFCLWFPLTWNPKDILSSFVEEFYECHNQHSELLPQRKTYRVVECALFAKVEMKVKADGFLSWVIRRMLYNSIDPIFLWLIGGD
jgi:hypothetical protein